MGNRARGFTGKSVLGRKTPTGVSATLFGVFACRRFLPAHQTLSRIHAVRSVLQGKHGDRKVVGRHRRMPPPLGRNGGVRRPRPTPANAWFRLRRPTCFRAMLLVRRLSRRPAKTRGPEAAFAASGPKTWQQPTLAGPNVLLPLAARGLTAVFGMGTGGTPGKWSPGRETRCNRVIIRKV